MYNVLPALQLLQHPWVAQGHTEAGEHNLSHFKNAMKAYNARRKFKATIMTVQLMGTLGRAMKTSTAEKAAAAAEGGQSRWCTHASVAEKRLGVPGWNMNESCHSFSSICMCIYSKGSASDTQAVRESRSFDIMENEMHYLLS